MLIGMLTTGSPPPGLADRHPGYDRMIADLLRAQEPSLEFRSYDVRAGELPASIDACDGWAITGSRHGVYDDLPWIAPLKAFVRQAIQAGRPVIGICFGHQLMAEAMGGKAAKAETGWGVGVHTYTFTQRPDWLEPGQDDITLSVVHQDQVLEVPPGAQILAGNAHCPVGILAYGDNALSFQSHPEFSRAFMTDLIADRRGVVWSDQQSDQALSSLQTETQSALAARALARTLVRAHRGSPGRRTAIA